MYNRSAPNRAHARSYVYSQVEDDTTLCAGAHVQQLQVQGAKALGIAKHFSSSGMRSQLDGVHPSSICAQSKHSRERPSIKLDW